MRKKYIFGILFTLLILITTGCNNKNYDFKLRIKESSWSGWTQDYEPEEVTNEYEIVLGKKYSINSGNLVFTIKKVNRNYIVIKTTEPFSDNDKGIDLNSNKKEFKVYFEKELELVTPTTDAGDIYYLTLSK